MYCEHCGAVMKQSDYACPVCGRTKLQDAISENQAGVVLNKKVYCEYCGTPRAASNPKCPSCGQGTMMTFGNAAPVNKKRSNIIKIALFAGIPLLLILCVILINNSGIYYFKNYSYMGDQIKYMGTMDQMFTTKQSMVTDFVISQEVNDRNVLRIECNDYILLHESGGMIDSVDDDVTFYGSGLQEISSRFATGYCFSIITTSRNQYHEYYFMNRYDVLRWLELNT